MGWRTESRKEYRPLRSFSSRLPHARARRDRWFYPRYDAAYLFGSTALIATLELAGVPGATSNPVASLLLALPFAVWAHILASVFIHNASHGNFPAPWNRAIGEICGLIVLTRFASWEIVHHRHHRYSDDPDRDPHPAEPSFWGYVRSTIVGVERQLQRSFLEAHGDTPANRRFERRRAALSYLTNAVVVAAWWRVLGPGAFLALFLPANLVGALHILHFNWRTHDGPAGRGFRPVDLDHGVYRLGNRLLFGVYMHATHHKNPRAFDPWRHARRPA